MMITRIYCKKLSKFFIGFSFFLLCFLCYARGESIYQSKYDLDSFDTEKAEKTIENLQASIESITQQLYELDNKEISSD
jgi:cell division protein FtsB